MKIRIVLAASTLLFFFIACGPQTGKDAGGEATDTTALTEAQKAEYEAKGMEIAGAAFTALSTRLKKALDEGGVAEAVRYCNVVAMPLVDSLSQVHGADIRRTSRKARNPQDRPTDAEQAVLQLYHRQAEAGEPLKPLVRRTGAQQIAFYAPIKMQALCLNCHGAPGETMREEDYAVIKELYPEDEAIGYAEGDLRGMWSITFKQ